MRMLPLPMLRDAISHLSSFKRRGRGRSLLRHMNTNNRITISDMPLIEPILLFEN